MQCLAVYMKEGLPFARDVFLENFNVLILIVSYLCFRLALLDSVAYFLFLYWSTFFVFVHGCFCYPLANVFVFTDVKFHHKNWPTYSGGSDRLGELVSSVISFLSQTNLLKLLTFLLGRLFSQSFTFGFSSYFYPLVLVFIMQCVLFSIENFWPCWCLCFHSKLKLKGDSPFHSTAFYVIRTGWDGLHDQLL